jgi:putative two-component system response regulator
MAEQIARSHHERWDGTGYPMGLRGEAISLPARITTIADQYDALRTRRAYKPAFSHAEAVRIITEGDGRTLPTHFDPRVLEMFTRNAGRLGEIFQQRSES